MFSNNDVIYSKLSTFKFLKIDLSFLTNLLDNKYASLVTHFSNSSIEKLNHTNK